MQRLLVRFRTSCGCCVLRACGRFTLIEMLVVIAIIGILASLLMPTLQSSLQLAKKINCASNQKQIGIGASLYVSENQQSFPLSCGEGWVHPYWTERLGQYMGYPSSHNSVVVDILQCPADQSQKGTGWICSYALNGGGAISGEGVSWACLSAQFSNNSLGSAKITDIQRPSKTVLLYDKKRSVGQLSLYEGEVSRMANEIHTDGSNVLFCDGHVTYELFGSLERADYKRKK